MDGSEIIITNAEPSNERQDQDNAGKGNIVVEIPNTGVPESDTTEDATVDDSVINDKEATQEASMADQAGTTGENVEVEKSKNFVNENSTDVLKNENMEEDLPPSEVPLKKVENMEETDELPNPGPPVPKSQEVKTEEDIDDLPNPGPPVPVMQRPDCESDNDLDLVMKNITPFHTDVEQFEIRKDRPDYKKQDERPVNDISVPNIEATEAGASNIVETKNLNIENEPPKQENSTDNFSRQDIHKSEEKIKESSELIDIKDKNSSKVEFEQRDSVETSENIISPSKQEAPEISNAEDQVPYTSDPTKISVQVPPVGVETPEPGEHQDMKLARSPAKSLRVHYDNEGPEYHHYSERFMDEDDLGIYDDMGDDGDLSDADEYLHMLSNNDHRGLRGSKVRKSKKTMQGGTDRGDYSMGDEPGYITIVPPPSVSLSDMRHYSGMRGKACTPASRISTESRNASRLNLESREAMFKRAMTLLSARCTSVAPTSNGGPSVEAQFGVSSKGQVIGIQNPQYFYIKQEKPRPMPPLKAWNGYNGNVYFEPLLINGVKDSSDQDELHLTNGNKALLTRSNSKFRKLSLSRKRASSDRPDSGATRSSKHTAKSISNKSTSSLQKQIAMLDKRTVLNRFSDNVQEDLDWFDGQNTTGSLSVRPKSDLTMDRERRKEIMYNRERICKGSVIHKVPSDDMKRRPKIPLKVNGGRFVPHNQMSPLLRTQTQYSLSNHRLTTNSPDPYHQALPPLEQLRATVRHMDTAEAANKPGYRYNKSVTITEEIKPFVKYSVDVKAKRPTTYA